MPSFKPVGLIFRPISIAGWVISLFALAFCLHILLFVDGRSHSVSDTFYGVLPYWVPTFLVWMWIANRTSCNGGSGISN